MLRVGHIGPVDDLRAVRAAAHQQLADRIGSLMGGNDGCL
jgi:hypothetical protein